MTSPYGTPHSPQPENWLYRSLGLDQGGEPAPVLVGRNAETPEKRSPHRLGRTEPGPGCGNGDEHGFGLEQASGGVDPDLLDVVAGWASQ